MIGECLGESRDLDGMQARELIARRLQLDRRCVSREITDVGPVEHFDSFLCSCKTGGRESSPQSLQTDVSAGHTPIACGFDDLNVVHTNHAFAVDVDQLLIEHVARKQHFTLAAHERAQVENVGIQAHAVLVQLGDAPARQEEITAAIARDNACHRRMIVGAQTHDNVLHSGDTFTFKIAYRPT